MRTDNLPMTPQGLQKLKDELKHLKSVERPKNVEAIEVARGHGDLSENADYDAAKEKQGHIHSRMLDLEDKIARAQVIDPATLKLDKIVFGATVRLLDVNSGDEFVYQIVGEDESNVKEGRISVQSVIAKHLIGKSKNEVVNITTPKGSKEYEVLEIRFE